MSSILDEDIDILMPVIGGYNSASLFPYLDFDKIKNTKKILCRYSDITALQMAFLEKINFSIIYGASLIPTFGEYHSKNIFGESSFFQALIENNYDLIPPEKWSNQLLNALKLYKIFDNLKGLIFSKPEIYNNKNSGLKYEELIDEIVGKRNYPIIYNFDCGHIIPSICILQNGIMNLIAKNGEVKIKIEKNY